MAARIQRSRRTSMPMTVRPRSPLSRRALPPDAESKDADALRGLREEEDDAGPAVSETGRAGGDRATGAEAVHARERGHGPIVWLGRAVSAGLAGWICFFTQHKRKETKQNKNIIDI